MNVSDTPSPVPASVDNPAAATSEATVALRFRPVRVLIGWLTLDEGHLWLSGRVPQAQPNDAHIARCQRARDIVAQRPPGIDQSTAFTDVPASLASHFAALDANPRFAQVRADIGEPKMVDLTKICAAQATVVVEAALERTKAIAPDDRAAIAELTLPTQPRGQKAVVNFDQRKNAWVLSSPNPNLRVLGHFNGDPDGFHAFGFLAETSMSYLHVAGVRGRYFLRDGYHRAYGLLSAGITMVPAFVKNHASIEAAAMPPGLLPQDAFLGDRPAMLTDYLNVDVSAPAEIPMTQRVVIIQALEVDAPS